MQQNLVLIGPVAVGKSTVARLLAAQRAAPHYALDDLRWTYFAEIGFDPALQRQIWEREGMDGVVRYWQPFEAHALERVLTDYHGAIIDCGGGYTIQDDPALFAQVQQTLLPHQVVLLLPAEDLTRAVQILRERTSGMLPDSFDLATHIRKHQATRSFAKLIVTTDGLSPEVTCDYILAQLSSLSAR